MERDFAAARQALDAGELRHAGFHLGQALAVHPHEPSYLALAEELYRRAGGDPERIAPLDEQGRHVALLALRAYLLARHGAFSEAMQLLLQVAAAKPSVPYLAWTERWLESAEAVARLDADTVATQVKVCMEQLDASAGSPSASAAVFGGLVVLLGRLREVYPRHEGLALLHALAARRGGHVMEALEVARGQHASAPSYLTAVALAGAHREIARVDEALAAYREALRHEPESLAPWLDMGDLLLEADRLQDALDAYDQVLAREPEHPWALPSSHYVRHRRQGGVQWLEQLEDVAESAPHNARALALRDAATPYVGFLPSPSESTINALRELARRERDNPRPAGQDLDIRMEVSWLEAPSAKLAGDMLLRRLHPRGRLAVMAEGIPQPDPRRARAPIRWTLWHYEDTEARPALPPPPEAIARRIAELAASPYHITAWKACAVELAAALDPTSVEALLALMVHPPLAAGDLAPWDWLQRLQLAAALTVGAIDEGDRPVWDEASLRRQALTSLILGPVDWVAAAGLVALTELARDEPDALEDVAGPLCCNLLNAPPSAGFWCLEEPLVNCVLRLPGVPAPLRAMLRRHRAQLYPPRDGATDAEGS